MFQFPRYLPLLDPDRFSEVDFYRDLERIGYRMVLLGGTGSNDLSGVARRIKESTSLQVALYPVGPDSVTDQADVIILPDVMNSNAHHARPFGTVAVATGMNVARLGLDYVPVAYFIMGRSTAQWFFDAFLVPDPKIILAYANYARMIGYPYLALDYEDPDLDIDPDFIAQIRRTLGDGTRLVISDEFTPESGARALEMGAHTLITPSDIYEEADDPVALAQAFFDRLLA